MIHGGDGIVYARTILRLPEPNKWDKDELAKIKATPWSLHTPKDTEVVFKDKKEIDRVNAENKILHGSHTSSPLTL